MPASPIEPETEGQEAAAPLDRGHVFRPYFITPPSHDGASSNVFVLLKDISLRL